MPRDRRLPPSVRLNLRRANTGNPIMPAARFLVLFGCLAWLGVSTIHAGEALSTAVEKHLGNAVDIAGHPVKTRLLVDAMATAHVPGVSIAVIRDGRLAWTGTYGVTDAAGKAITAETVFQAGSISKSIAALTVLRLAGADKVSLDAPVNTYLKRWTLPDSDVGKASDVTLRRLLAHMAGTNVHGFPGYDRDSPVPTLVDILDGKPPANTPPVRITGKPGAAWSYSGGGYVIAQQVVDDVTGHSFADWSATQWMQPAGMSHSRFGLPPGSSIALGHDAQGKTVTGGYHLYPEQAAAGLWTTPSDLARALIALRHSLKGDPGALLPTALAEVVLKPLLPGHSVGFDTGGGTTRWIAKGGDTEGFAGYLVFYPETGNGAIVTTNGAQGSTLAQDVVRAIATAERWPDFHARTRHATPISGDLLERLPGTYVYRQTNRFTIARQGNVLTMASPGETPERLYRDVNGEYFTLSQDVAFVFDETATSGHIKADVIDFPFRKE